MEQPVILKKIQESHKNLIRTFLYFDIFQYPLHKHELSIAVQNHTILQESLDELISLGVVEQKNDLFFLKGKTYEKRIVKQSASSHFYKKAKGYASLINKFPFVRGVYISGSLSKDWADETTDVDYFIITSPQRLWLCRTMLILFKKIFLLNSRKYFCLNYFIDTDHLEIEEKNIFTATEVSFLKPLINEKLYQEFIGSNQWVKDYYPLYPLVSMESLVQQKEVAIKKGLEKLLSGTFGENLDIWSMKRTLKFWKGKFPEMEHLDFEINFKSNRTISKHHPSGFQKRVVESLEEKISEFEKSFGISLQ